MADLVSVEFAFGGPSPVFVIVSPSTPFVRVSVELCVHTILSSARLKSVNTAVSTRSSPTLLAPLPAVGATMGQKFT